MRPFSFAHLMILGLGFILTFASAEAANLSVVGGLSRYNPSTNPDPPPGSVLSARSAFSLGALVDFPIAEQYRFETGVIHDVRATVLEDAVSTTESSSSGWLIPLTFRFMRADFLGFGFGPYLAFFNGLDMGLRVNLRIALPVWREFKALFDASYLIGFTDLNKSPTAEDKNQELLLFAGIQFPISSESRSTGEKP